MAYPEHSAGDWVVCYRRRQHSPVNLSAEVVKARSAKEAVAAVFEGEYPGDGTYDVFVGEVSDLQKAVVKRASEIAVEIHEEEHS